MVYHASSPERRHLIVYDLGGGTFDVSIVRIESGVVEVLSSQGDTHLGGDDFDELLTKHVADAFLSEHNIDLMGQSNTRWRLIQACERAKCELSYQSHVRIMEEFIATVDGKPVSLDMDVSRHDYEQLIAPLVDRTIECVDQAIRDSGLLPAQLDELILVGGSTRTPLVQQRLQAEFKRDPQWSVNPDLAVALGAATQAAMQAGHDVGPVLIDVATHTLGVEAIMGSLFDGELGFCPIIRRNSPLPATYEDAFRTATPGQDAVRIRVFQGESRQLSHNRLIGEFMFEGLSEEGESDGEILVKFSLTLDGVLKVTASERQTVVYKSLKIDNALAQMSSEGREASEDRLASMFDESDEFHRSWGEGEEGETIDVVGTVAHTSLVDVHRVDSASEPEPKLIQLVKRAQSVRQSLSSSDAGDVDRLLKAIQDAEQNGAEDTLAELQLELDDLLFYLVE